MKAKADFIKSPLREKFESLIVQEAMQQALDSSLLEFVQEQPITGDVSSSWDAHSQLIGARKFISILSNLHLIPTVTKGPKFENLKPI